MRDRKRAVGAGALGVHDALWDAFAVEVRHFLVQDVVLQQDGATRANGHGIIVLDVGPALRPWSVCAPALAWLHPFMLQRVDCCVAASRGIPRARLQLENRPGRGGVVGAA